jgi:2-phosphoglycerate kinase
MRGIVVHSLMARGVAFEDAYRIADEVRARVGDRAVVQKSEIAKALRELLGEEPFQEDRAVPLPVDIAVTGRGEPEPFSKGHLSQSLLAAALDPHDAFDVAREIERELVLRGIREIERRQLRRIAFEALTRQGKTSLALEVAHRLGIGRMLSTDSIRQIMRIMLSQDLIPTIYASSYNAHKLLPPESQGEDPVIEGFLSQASTVSVGVRASMDRAIAENASLVMDGVSLVPGLIDLNAYAGLVDVIFLMISTLDEDAFESRFVARAASARQRAPHRYLENLGSILRIQKHLLKLADRHDVPIVDNVSFDQSVLQIIRHVTESLREKGDFDAAHSL